MRFVRVLYYLVVAFAVLFWRRLWGAIEAGVEEYRRVLGR